jgi:hypothetical protein
MLIDPIYSQSYKNQSHSMVILALDLITVVHVTVIHMAEYVRLPRGENQCHIYRVAQVV